MAPDVTFRFEVARLPTITEHVSKNAKWVLAVGVAATAVVGWRYWMRRRVQQLNEKVDRAVVRLSVITERYDTRDPDAIVAAAFPDQPDDVEMPRGVNPRHKRRLAWALSRVVRQNHHAARFSNANYAVAKRWAVDAIKQCGVPVVCRANLIHQVALKSFIPDEEEMQFLRASQQHYVLSHYGFSYRRADGYVGDLLALNSILPDSE